MRNKLACIFAACLLAVSAAALPALAAEEGTGFTPSVVNKPAPEVDIDNTEVTVGGEVVDLNDANSGLRIVITPISKADDAPNDELTDDLKDAAGDVAAKNDEEFVFASDDDEKAFNDFKDQAIANGKILACSNLFDLSIVDYDGNKVDIEKGTFTLAVPDADNLVLVMHKHDGSWAVVDFTNNGDGTITFTLDGLSPIAFFTQADAAKVIDDIDTTSQTSSDTTSQTSSDTTSQTSSDTTSQTSSEDEGKTSSGTSSAKDTASTASNKGDASNTSSTGSGKSPQTGVEGGSIFLVSAIVTALAGAAFVVKAKKE